MNDLNLIHMNIGGQRRNLEGLIFTLSEIKNYIASIKETFLITRRKRTIPGNKIIRKNRSTGQSGRVTLKVKNDLSFSNFELNINNSRGDVEYDTRKINTKSLDELIICSYYSPKELVYEHLFKKLDNKSNNLLIIGDFNAKHINLGPKETNH